ncbi:peptide/nickel transport system permease protein [Sinosporangium album]|uniref:Peptide/nickel transport system permease protein n=1 Tax=Sinosporangium album TaxID=504805 RepID=A0A1G7QPP1_9ACTN|nr:ABC transporter permease [Sinosporangium album]SDG00468.1 peptide/nickel transport system permease protein [Sinosporangium album]
MVTEVAPAPAPPPVARAGGRHLLHLILRDRIGAIGVVIVIVMTLAAVFAPLLAPYDPTAMSGHRLAPPSGTFPLGADEAGRDLLSRTLYGARTSLTVSLIVVSFAGVIGVVLGLLAGYYRGLLDGVISPMMDVLFSFPTLLLALAVVAARGPGTENLILALVIVFIPNFARVVRGTALSVSKEPYVESARAVGLSNTRIIFKYVLPNSVAPIAVQFTTTLAYAILIEASLGYLGLGVQPPEPSWGSMLSSGKAFMELSLWPSLVPGMCIMITVLGFNLLGDTLRDALDPRLRGRR